MELPVARAELVLAASPERIWRALEPTGLCGWLCEEASGDLIAGEVLRLGWPSLGLETELEVIDALAGQRLVLAGTGDATGERQTSMLEPHAPGTRLSILHAGLGAGARARDRAAGSAAGLHVALRLLDLYLGGREGQRLTARAALGTIAAPIERLWASALGDAAAIGSWLGAIEGEPGDEGDHLRVTLGRRGRDARVLARAAPFELALVLPSLDAVLRLRLIGLDPSLTLACAQLVSWAGEEALAPLATPLADALGRLVDAHGGSGSS